MVNLYKEPKTSKVLTFLNPKVLILLALELDPNNY